MAKKMGSKVVEQRKYGEAELVIEVERYRKPTGKEYALVHGRLTKGGQVVFQVSRRADILPHKPDWKRVLYYAHDAILEVEDELLERL